jgi:hypothetical protein
MKTVSIGLVIVGLLNWSCAVTDVDRTADLAQYKTFGWGQSRLDVKKPAYKSDLIDSNIKADLKTEFVKKGVTYSAKKPDLLVSYEGYTETKERGYSGGSYYYPYYFYPYYSIRVFPYGGSMMGPLYWGGPEGSFTYTLGTLVVNIREQKTGKLVWRGVTQGNVDDLKSLNKNISKGIKAIMKKYPAVPPKLIPIPKGKVS